MGAALARFVGPFSLVIALGACDPGVTLGVVCTRSSECPAPLVCAESRCREECADHRDCPLMARCVRGNDGLGACTLPDDECSATSCEDDLVCAGGACVDPCRDGSCPAGGVCDEGVCARPDAVMSRDAGTDATSELDASTPAWVTRRACTSRDDCDEGELCSRIGASANACRMPCAESGGTCAPSGTTPSSCVRVRHPDVMDGYGCTIACDPRTNEGCLPGDACDLVSVPDSFSVPIVALECRPLAGARAHGESCAGPEPLVCAAGTSCTASSDGATWTCIQLCALDGSGPPCPSGTECRSDPERIVRFGSTVIGRCLPE